jgi:hypothetical protein
VLQVRGGRRIEAATGLCGAAALGLLAARVVAPTVSKVVEARAVLQNAARDVNYPYPASVGPFVSFSVAMAFVVASAVLWLAIARALRVRAPRAYRAWAWGPPVVALCWAASASLELALLTALAAGLAVVFVAPHVATGLATPQPTAVEISAAFVVACEGIAAAWAIWICTAPRGTSLRHLGLASILVILALTLLRSWRLRRDREVDLQRDAVAASPLLLLAPLAVFRAPSPWVVVATFLLAIAIRAWIERHPSSLRWNARLATVLAPWAIGTIAIVPLGMREAKEVNLSSHEGLHYGWVNSALHGKLLWADAGLIHAPLRDYLLTLYSLVFGATAEHLRMASVLVNVVGLALLLPVAARLTRGRLWLQLWCAYLLVADTPARLVVVYSTRISLGWADLTRNAWSTLALVLAVEAVTAARPSSRRVVGCGVFAGLGLLYSWEYGLCAVVAVLLATVADAVLRETGPWATRTASVARRCAFFLGGVLLPLLVMFGLYALLGRGPRLLRTARDIVTLSSAGIWGSLPFPIRADTFLRPYSLIQAFITGEADPRYHDADLQYLLPGAVYGLTALVLVLQIARRRWSERSTLLLALLLFGAAGYRVTLSAPDIYHLLSATVPALLLLVALSADTSRFGLWTADQRWLPVGAVAVVLVALSTVAMAERDGCGLKKVALVRDETEHLSRPVPFVYDDVPRAGDIHIDSGTLQVVRYVREQTTPKDPIFVDLGRFAGPEIYWLSDRRNPTRFDMLQEILSRGHQQDLLESLHKDPPLYVIGDSSEAIGDQVVAYLSANWETLPERPGGYVVRRRRDAR